MNMNIRFTLFTFLSTVYICNTTPKSKKISETQILIWKYIDKIYRFLSTEIRTIVNIKTRSHFNRKTSLKKFDMKKLILTTSIQDQLIKIKKETNNFKKELHIHRAMMQSLEPIICMDNVRFNSIEHLNEGQGKNYCDKDICLADCQHPRNFFTNEM